MGSFLNTQIPGYFENEQHKIYFYTLIFFQLVFRWDPFSSIYLRTRASKNVNHLENGSTVYVSIGKTAFDGPCHVVLYTSFL